MICVSIDCHWVNLPWTGYQPPVQAGKPRPPPVSVARLQGSGPYRASTPSPATTPGGRHKPKAYRGGAKPILARPAPLRTHGIMRRERFHAGLVGSWGSSVVSGLADVAVAREAYEKGIGAKVVNGPPSPSEESSTDPLTKFVGQLCGLDTLGRLCGFGWGFRRRRGPLTSGPRPYTLRSWGSYVVSGPSTDGRQNFCLSIISGSWGSYVVSGLSRAQPTQ